MSPTRRHRQPHDQQQPPPPPPQHARPRTRERVVEALLSVDADGAATDVM
jgi:hypothetical protein